jgi:hypothetical protein
VEIARLEKVTRQQEITITDLKASKDNLNNERDRALEDFKELKPEYERLKGKRRVFVMLTSSVPDSG